MFKDLIFLAVFYLMPALIIIVLDILLEWATKNSKNE